MDSITQHIPDGFFKRFVDTFSEGEICPRFLLFSALSGVGALIRRRVKLTFGRGLPPLFPNPWVILVAPPGRGHKTTTINIVRNLIMKLPPHHQPKFVSAKITPEALVKALARVEEKATWTEDGRLVIRPEMSNATGFIVATELAVFLGKQTYNIGMVALLTELYDCHDEWKCETLSRGVEMLRNVCLSILAASTPAWLNGMLPQDAFTGGFMSRFILVSMPENWVKRVAPFDISPLPEHELNELVDELLYFAKVSGEAELTEDAKQWYREWLVKHSMKMREAVGDQYLAVLERKEQHLLRIALLFALSQHRLNITRQDLECALGCLDSLEEGARGTGVMDILAANPLTQNTRLVLDVIKKNSPVSRTKLCQLCWKFLARGSRELDEIIQTLEEAGLVKTTWKGTRRVYYYIGKEGNHEGN